MDRDLFQLRTKKIPFLAIFLVIFAPQGKLPREYSIFFISIVPSFCERPRIKENAENRRASTVPPLALGDRNLGHRGRRFYHSYN